MIRCVRIWTSETGHSVFEEGSIALADSQRGDLLSGRLAATGVSFRESQPGSSFSAHDAPIRQLVFTLGGTLEFRTATGQTFAIRAGDVLLAEDTTGSGHSWRLTDDGPWRRAYVVLGDTPVPFAATPR